MRCCTVNLKRAWEYCPCCGEQIEWPPTLAQLAERAARQAEHLRRMETDPVYASRYESDQKLLNWTMSEMVKQYAEADDPFVGLAGRTPDVAV